MSRLAVGVGVIGLVCAGVLAVIDPGSALAAGGAMAALGLVSARPDLLRFGVVALVLTPTVGLLRSTGTGLASAAASELAHSIESGSMVNRSAATLLFLIGLWFIGLRKRQLGQVNLIPWFGLFAALIFGSMAWSESSGLTLRRSVEALFILVFALGTGGVYLANRAQGHAEVVRMICWGSTLMTFGILIAFGIRGEIHLTSAAWRLGHEGTENQVGWVASVGMLLAWATRTRCDVWPDKAMLRFQLIVPALGVLLSKSREVWLGVLAGILVLELGKGRRLRQRIGGLLLVIVVVGGMAMTPAGQALWERGAQEEDLQSASGRTQLWEAAWPLIRGHMWLGHGLGAFWTPTTVVALSSHWTPTSLHNGYLDTLAELGVAGMAVISLCFLVSARNAWRLMQHPDYREIGLALLVLYASLVVINGFASVLEVFNYFPVTAVLVYSFFVSRRLSMLRTNSR